MSDSLTNSEEEKSKLLAERARLRDKLDAIEADYRRGLTADSEDRAIELENADVLEGVARSIARELEDIEEKLSELE